MATWKEHTRKNFLLAWPVIVGQLGHVTTGIADAVMIGRTGTVPLAAGAFALSIFIIPMVFGIGVAYGLTTPVANADGEGKPALAGRYLSQGFYLNLLIGLLLLIPLYLVNFFLPHFGQEAAVTALAAPYFQIISLSLVPMLIALCFKQFAEGLGDTRVAMLVSLGANLLNIGLNYLLIYGHWGFPAWGLNGAGVATLISRILMAVALAWYVLRKPAFARYREGLRWRLWDRIAQRDILVIGLPSGLQYIFEVSAFAFAAIMVGWISADALAAHQIAITLATLSYMAASGFAAAANVRVSNQKGAGDLFNMRRAAHSNFMLTAGLMALWGLIFYLGRRALPAFYTDDPLVIALASQLMVVAVFFQLFDGLQAVALGALRGMAETRIPTLITFLAYWGIGLSASYWLGIEWGWGAPGIWYGLALGLVAAALLLLWRFEHRSRYLWQNRPRENEETIPSRPGDQPADPRLAGALKD